MFHSNLLKYILLVFLYFHVPILPATIIFDLNGVLAYQDTYTTCKNAGFGNLLFYVLFNGPHVKKLFSRTLHAIPYQSDIPQDAEDGRGETLAPIMIGWLKGEIDGNQLIDRVDQFLATKPACCATKSKQQLIKRLTRAIFKPTSFAQATRFYEHAIKLVNSCKQAGHKVYILSNWDAHSFAYIRQWYPEFCALFDGIILSGEINLVKPEKEIYTHIIHKYNLDPRTTAFIDDQRVNIRTAKECGLFGIHCKQKKRLFSRSPDIRTTGKKLNAWLNKINEKCLH